MAIFDFHAHIYPDAIAEKATESVSRFYDVKMAAIGTVSELLRCGDEAGVDRFVVHSVATSPKQVSSINHFVAEQCTLYPDRLIGFGTMHPDLEDFAAAVEEMDGLNLRGVKLHSDFQKFNIDDRVLYPLYELLAGRFPLLLHMGDARYDYSHPRRLRKMMSDFPSLTVVGAHLGGYSVWDEAVDCLADTNCFVDTCSSLAFLSPEHARDIIRKYGAERVLFGVDFPMWRHTEELAFIDALGLSSDELELIFWKNAARILGLEAE